MRRVTVLLAIVALLALPAVALAAEELSADLTAEAEVPAPTVPSDYAGSGSASATISDDESQIDVEVSFENLTGDAVGAHIHYGAAGAAGGIIFPLDHTGGSPISQTLTEADFTPVEGGPQTYAEALAAMRAGDTYINVHTEMNPPGELRGQLRALPDTATSGDATSTGAWLGLLMLTVAGAAFLVTYRRLAARPV
jgi:hypothetical protein